MLNDLLPLFNFYFHKKQKEGKPVIYNGFKKLVSKPVQFYSIYKVFNAI